MIYRLYFVDGYGYIRSVKQLNCNSDAAATDEAARQAYVHRMELWQQDRIVKYFDTPDHA